MSTYVMTDSHGHYDPMKRMLDKIGFSAGDRMILAGDYFDVYGIVGNLVEHGMVIAGHTPTTAMYELPFNHGNVYRFYDEDTDCIFYDLDCGYAFKDIEPEGKLACLRLEDERIFYV